MQLCFPSLSTTRNKTFFYFHLHFTKMVCASQKGIQQQSNCRQNSEQTNSYSFSNSQSRISFQSTFNFAKFNLRIEIEEILIKKSSAL